MSSCWQSCDAFQLAWASDGEAHVVYHRPSGITHLLNHASYQLIAEFLVVPATIEQIAAFFATDDDASVHPEHLQQIASLVHRLEQVGLVRHVAKQAIT